MKLYQVLYIIIKNIKNIELINIENDSKKYFLKKYFKDIKFNEKKLNDILLNNYNIYITNIRNKIKLYNKCKCSGNGKGKNIILKKNSKEWSNLYVNNKLLRYINDNKINKKMIGGKVDILSQSTELPTKLSTELPTKQHTKQSIKQSDILKINLHDITLDVRDNDFFTNYSFNDYKKDFLISHLDKLSNIKNNFNNPYITYNKFKKLYNNNIKINYILNDNLKDMILSLNDTKDIKSKDIINNIIADIITHINKQYYNQSKSLNKINDGKVNRNSKKYKSIGGNNISPEGNNFLSVLHIFDKKHDFYNSSRLKNINKEVKHYLPKNNENIFDHGEANIKDLIHNPTLQNEYLMLFRDNIDFEENLLIYGLNKIINNKYSDLNNIPLLFSFLRINDIKFVNFSNQILNNSSPDTPENIIYNYIKDFYNIRDIIPDEGDVNLVNQYKYRYIFDTNIQINKKTENQNGIRWETIKNVINKIAFNDTTIESKWDPHSSLDINVHKQNDQQLDNNFYIKYLQNITDKSFNEQNNDTNTAFRKLTKDNFRLEYFIYNNIKYTSLQLINPTKSFLNSITKNKTDKTDLYFIKDKNNLNEIFYYYNGTKLNICWNTNGFSVQLLLNKIIELEIENDNSTSSKSKRKTDSDIIDDRPKKYSNTSRKSKKEYNSINDDYDTDETDSEDESEIEDEVELLKIKNTTSIILFEIVRFLKSKDINIKDIINILYDFKKSGDWGQALYCLNSNNNKIDNIFVSGDRLSALHSLLRINIKTIFGIERNFIEKKNIEKRINMIGIYNGNSDITIRQFLELFRSLIEINNVYNKIEIKDKLLQLLTYLYNKDLKLLDINNRKIYLDITFKNYFINHHINNRTIFLFFRSYVLDLLNKTLETRKTYILNNLSNYFKEDIEIIKNLYNIEITKIIDKHNTTSSDNTINYINNLCNIIINTLDIFNIFETSFCKFNGGDLTLLEYYLKQLKINVKSFSLYNLKVFIDNKDEYVSIKKLIEEQKNTLKTEPDRKLAEELFKEKAEEIEHIRTAINISSNKYVNRTLDNFNAFNDLKLKLEKYFKEIINKKRKGDIDNIDDIVDELNLLINSHNNDLSNKYASNESTHIYNMLLYIDISLNELEFNIVKNNNMINKFLTILNIKEGTDNELFKYIKNKYLNSEYIVDVSNIKLIKKNIKDIYNLLNTKYAYASFHKKYKKTTLSSYNNYASNMDNIIEFFLDM